MKLFYLTILIIWILTASIAAQNVGILPPPKVFDKPEKMLFKGVIFHNFFEMTLTWDGDKLSGSYFLVKSGNASARTVRGKIEADGKIILLELNPTNKTISEFRGKIIENSDDLGLEFEGDWKSGSREKSQDFYASGLIIGLTGNRRIETKYIKEKSVRRRFEIDASYPQIVGRNTPGARGFNLLAKQSVIEPLAEFRKMMQHQTAEDIKHLRDEGNTFTASPEIKFADDHLISVVYFYSENSNGMPRSFDYIGTLNYDLEKNRELKLADLFKPGAKYLETISAYCLKILQSRTPENGQKLADSNGVISVKADAENYNWNLMKKGLLISFEEYEIVPISAGTQSVLIPYSEFKNIAKPNGVLAKMMK